MNSTDYFPAYKEITLEKMEIGIRKRMPLYLMDQQVDVVYDYISQYMEVELRGFLWGEKVDRIEISYPEDWIEAFKERWFPKWLKEKFPVKYYQYVVDVRAIYPKLNVSLPKEYHTLKLAVTEGVDWVKPL